MIEEDKCSECSECPICLDKILSDIESGIQNFICPECNKNFHRKCLINWFDTILNCPCCRMDYNNYLKNSNTINSEYVFLINYIIKHPIKNNENNENNENSIVRYNIDRSIRTVINRVNENAENDCCQIRIETTRGKICLGTSLVGIIIIVTLFFV